MLKAVKTDVLQELKSNSESNAIDLLLNKYPFLEGHSLEMLMEYNDYSFKSSVNKWITQEINRMIQLKTPPEDY